MKSSNSRIGSSTSVNAYIAAFPAQARLMLEQLRQAVRQAAPQAEEGISYGMPSYKQNGILVYIGGFQNHVSLFPTGAGIKPFENELQDYQTSKGTVQFPLGTPVPLAL